MKPPQLNFAEQERRFVSQKKKPLPLHTGPWRVQSALDHDRPYREMVLATFGAALLAGSGFDKLPNIAGPFRSALFCLAVSGLALRAVAVRHPVAGSSNRILEGSPVRTVGWVIALFGLLGSVLGGVAGLESMAYVFAAWAIILPAVSISKARVFGYGACIVGFVASTAIEFGNLASSFSAPNAVLGAAIATALAIGSFFANRSSSFNLRPALFLTTLAGQAWLALSLAPLLDPTWGWAVLAVSGAGLLLLERFLSQRTAFAPIIVAVGLTHLSGCLTSSGDLLTPLTPQIVAVLLEFGLLGMAGYRHARALVSQFPFATYRNSPQCLVPCLDRAWDHPLKIDAA